MSSLHQFPAAAFPVIQPRSKPLDCTGCPLEHAGTDFSQPEGTGRLGVAIIGEASGENEARDGLPFRPHAAAGGVLERTLRRLGYSREDFVVTNQVRCRPWGNELTGTSYERAAIDRCKTNLQDVLRRFQPKVLIALGNTALKGLTGLEGGKRTVTHVRGYVFRALPEFCEAAGVRDLLVVPTYHPSFLRRGAMHLVGVLARDIQRAVNIRAGKDRQFILDMPQFGSPDTVAPWEAGHVASDVPSVRDGLNQWLARWQLRYTLQPTRAELDAFCRDVKQRSDTWLALSPPEQARSLLALSHDIETAESASLDEDESDAFSDTRITLSQFSIEPGQAIVLDWENPEHQQATRWLLKLPLPKVGQNYWYFDRKVMRAVGRRDFADVNRLDPAGTVYDTLQQFHYMQPDLPAHLQYAASYTNFPFPWKHYAGSGLSMRLYAACDPDAALRVHQMTMRTMIDRGIWFDDADPERGAAGYMGMVQQVRPILERMEERGLPINNERRLALGAQFDKVGAELFAELDHRFPDDCRKLEPRAAGQVKGYADMPAEVKALLERLRPTAVPRFMEQTVVTPASSKRRKTGEVIETPEKTKVVVLDADGNQVTKKFRDEQIKAAFRARWDGLTETEMAAVRATRFSQKPDEEEVGPVVRYVNAAGHTVWVSVDPATNLPLLDEDKQPVEVVADTYFYDRRIAGQQNLDDGRRTPGRLAWVRVYQFSPNSSPQLMAYMRAKGHTVPFDKKKKTETTSKKELERLAARTKDDFYTKVIECREMGKMASVYIDGFKPAADGCVHTTFTFDTATGQLSSRRPNTQNYPSSGVLGKAIKSMIEAPTGFELANWDFKSYHVLMMGFLAEDSTYMRLARLDMHSFVTWHFLRLPGADSLYDLPDEEMLDKFRWLKEDAQRLHVRNKQAKPSILGIALGLMPPHLYEMNREHFASQRQAEQFRQLLQSLFPKVFRWQERTCDEAHQNNVLRNEFGMLRWFYEVKAPDRRGGWRPGDQWNAAMAFPVQSNAHGDLRERFKALRHAGLDEKYGLRNTIHDSLGFCYRRELREDMLREVGEVLGRPSNVLRHPVLAPEGLVIGVECAVGQNMAEMKVVEGV